MNFQTLSKTISIRNARSFAELLGISTTELYNKDKEELLRISNSDFRHLKSYNEVYIL